MARTLVLGAGGMLGSAFVAALPNALKAGRTALDIADLGQIERTIWSSTVRHILPSTLPRSIQKMRTRSMQFCRGS
jgi:dTDP-4-dehydrorhamnose reductase